MTEWTFGAKPKAPLGGGYGGAAGTSGVGGSWTKSFFFSLLKSQNSFLFFFFPHNHHSKHATFQRPLAHHHITVTAIGFGSTNS